MKGGPGVSRRALDLPRELSSATQHSAHNLRRCLQTRTHARNTTRARHASACAAHTQHALMRFDNGHAVPPHAARIDDRLSVKERFCPVGLWSAFICAVTMGQRGGATAYFPLSSLALEHGRRLRCNGSTMPLQHDACLM